MPLAGPGCNVPSFPVKDSLCVPLHLSQLRRQAPRAGRPGLLELMRDPRVGWLWLLEHVHNPKAGG
jgi:hypothetical protein